MHYYFLLPAFIVILSSCNPVQPTPAEKEEQATISHLPGTDLSEQVIIRRTGFGVPHIYADNMKAAGFALGYLQMEDYGEIVADRLLQARGEWARYNILTGRSLSLAIYNDAVNRRRYQRAVETWKYLEPDTRDFLSGFAAGVNRYTELNPEEFAGREKQVFTGYDVHSVDIIFSDHGKIRKFLSAHEKRKQGFPVSRDGRATESREAGSAEGSNVWALGPGRTTTGNAILMRNPHLPWDAGYYEARVKVPGKLNFYGDFRIGHAIGIVGGFNEHLGWATTNNYPDLDEIYSFDADPARPGHFLLDGASVPMTIETITVEFKRANGFGTSTRIFRSTPYGPVILREGGKIYFIRASGYGEYRRGEQFLKMMKAQNITEWKEAMRMQAIISSNITYADSRGNIFYVWNAAMPDRPHPAGGDTSAIHVTKYDQMWLDIWEWDALPQLENPRGSYLRNENDPFHFTNLNEVLPPENYPSYFPEPGLRLRSQHSIELIHNDQKFSLEDVVKLKHSKRMLLADRVKDDLVKAVEKADYGGEVAEALKLIKGWDNSVARDSRGGILFKTWWDRYVSTSDPANVEGSYASAGFPATPESLFKEPWSFENPVGTPRGLADFDRAAETFSWAVEETRKRYGHWNLPWGEVHRAVIGNVDVAVGGSCGLLGCFRTLDFKEHRYDKKKLEVSGGDGWIFAVEFGEIPRAYSVLAYGQSIKVNSPYYNDQLAIFAGNKMTPVAFTDEDVLKNMILEYRPGSR
jgi:acyl-homoserine-lactone acylase